MSIMIKQMVGHYLEADEIDDLIIKQQIAKDPGVKIFEDMLKKVADDIRIADEKTYNYLQNKISALNKQNIEKKEQIKNNAGNPEDSIDEGQLSSVLLLEDYNKYHNILYIIKQLFKAKGWFD